MGYSWPGVFLLGASGRTGRFFTQLLFHNPHSHCIFLNMTIELYCYISHNIQNNHLTTQLLYDWKNFLIIAVGFWKRNCSLQKLLLRIVRGSRENSENLQKFHICLFSGKYFNTPVCIYLNWRLKWIQFWLKIGNL